MPLISENKKLLPVQSSFLLYLAPPPFFLRDKTNNSLLLPPISPRREHRPKRQPGLGPNLFVIAFRVRFAST